MSYFFLECSGDHRDLHSFPTRRSSDLPATGQRRAEAGAGTQVHAPAHLGHARRPTPRHRARQPEYAPLSRSEEHTSELQSHVNLVCRLLLEKKKKNIYTKLN